MERLLGVHKYKDVTKVRPVIKKAALKAVERTSDFTRVEARFLRVGLSACDALGVSLNDGTRFECAAFEEKLQDCTEILAFIITLGPELDAAVSEGFADGTDPLGPLFLDTGGWLMIEAVTRAFSKYLKDEYFGPAHSLSMRMAPGYSYRVSGQEARVSWDLLDQDKLFSLFGATDLPVELMESGAMLPRMSRSGIFGVRAKS